MSNPKNTETEDKTLTPQECEVLPVIMESIGGAAPQPVENEDDDGVRRIKITLHNIPTYNP